MEDTQEYIFQLIATCLCGEELTPEEEEKLEQWRNASARNERFFQYYQTLFERRENLLLRDKIRISPEVYDRIFSHRNLKRRKTRTLLTYAAVIVPLLFVSVYLFFKQSLKPEVAVVEQVATSEVTPGKQKAQLLLENGEVLSLSDSSMSIESHRNIQVENGGVLQYAAADRQSKVKAVYHTLVVERGAEFQVILPDGTKVWLNSDSELKYPNLFNEGIRQVYLKGEAYFEVRHNEHQPFIVRAEDCVIRVLGTAFNVSSYAGESEIITTLVNGKVAYSAGKSQGELKPGEQCVYGKEAQIAQVRQVDVNQYISWKNGLFVFDRISMEDLSKQIARWYDIDVIFPDQAARHVSFTGAMERYKPVSYLIRMLNETNTVECSLEGKMLVFRKK